MGASDLVASGDLADAAAFTAASQAITGRQPAYTPAPAAGMDPAHASALNAELSTSAATSREAARLCGVASKYTSDSVSLDHTNSQQFGQLHPPTSYRI